jgi:hypothetical protein
MPIMLFWAAPAVMSGSGYYLMAFADFMDGVVALSAPAAAAVERRRSQFKVIQGGKN